LRCKSCKININNSKKHKQHVLSREKFLKLQNSPFINRRTNVGHVSTHDVNKEKERRIETPFQTHRLFFSKRFICFSFLT